LLPKSWANALPRTQGNPARRRIWVVLASIKRPSIWRKNPDLVQLRQTYLRARCRITSQLDKPLAIQWARHGPIPAPDSAQP